MCLQLTYIDDRIVDSYIFVLAKNNLSLLLNDGVLLAILYQQK